MNGLDGKINVKNIVIVILLLIIGGLVIFIVWDKNNDKESGKKNEVKEVIEEEKDNEDIEEEKITEIEIDKEKVNEKLEELNFAYRYILGDERFLENIDFDKELLLGDKQRMFNFAWVYSDLLNIKPVIYEKTITGEEVTGAYAVGLESFSNLYKDICGVDYDNETYDYGIKDGYIYGIVNTGIAPNEFVLKINNCTLKDNLYNVVIDVLYFEDEDSKNRYDEPYIYIYDDKYVVYQLVLEVEKKNELYTIKSFKASEK